jgi:hypothetical protein
MKVSVVVRTWNPVSTGRQDLLLRTMCSLAKTGSLKGHSVSLALIDNGSDDGVSDPWLDNVVARGHFDVVYRDGAGDGRGFPGRGVNRAVERALRDGPDLVCFSDDDMEWSPGWLVPVIRFFEESPPDLVLLSGLLEPLWNWNTPRDAVESGGVRVVVRDTVPGASWMFRAADWLRIGPVAPDHTHDIAGCSHLRKQNLRMAALDLANHIGAGRSTLGHSTDFGKPFPRQRWGINGPEQA